MLIEFKVANFRSIREQQTFSLVASKSNKELSDCLINRDLPGLSGLKFLRGAALYGANASGKSNLLQALFFLTKLIKTSATKLQPGEKTGTEPFVLDAKSAAMPSTFEITFLANEVRYLFGLSLTPQRIIEEYLVAYPHGLPQRWYHRAFREDTGAYEWAKPSPHFKHDRGLEEKTRENSLFLSVGPQFNHLQLTPVFKWFQDTLCFLNLGVESILHPSFSAERLRDIAHHDEILRLLQSADMGVVDALLQEKNLSIDDLKKEIPNSILEKIGPEATLKTAKRWEIHLTHKVEGGDPISFSFEDESTGTRRFFALVGPWLDILGKGRVALVDEIDTSLHPVLVKELLKLLFCSSHNPLGAQVVFATHNPVLLDSSLLRRDQVWFTEKSPSGATHLYPLTDYQPRKGEALAKGYLAGRYGAIPYLPEGLKL